MELNRKYIITEVLRTGVGHNNYVVINGVAIATPSIFRLIPNNSLGEEGLQVGDIIDIDCVGIYCKKQYKDCEPAMVMGQHENTVYAFCAKYGNIKIHIPEYTSDFDYLYTQRGDEILVQKTSDGKFEILTNKTIDKLRTNFLRNLQKQK